MNFFENITFRQKRAQSSANSSTTSLNLDGSTNSLANISADDNNIEMDELKQKIKFLTTQLNALHGKINKLTIENKEFKEVINKMSEKLEQPKTSTKILCTSGTLDNDKNIVNYYQNNKENMENVIGNTQQIITSKTDCNVKYTKKEDNNTQIKRNKLCIISANKPNNILSLAEKRFEKSQICHYSYPYCGIRQLITNLHKKLHDYTMDDHCIILIGEEDFRKTNNYFDIVIEIRKTLEYIKNTNIILCVPTYKYNCRNLMFNCRVETFNNLLHLDVTTHKYAYLFDSNLNLSCDYTMFSKYTGRLNNDGMKNIFDNISKLLNNTSSSNTPSKSILNVENLSKSDFFRL